MIRFCSSGTVAAPISTPRSPRATITASASASTSSSASTASAFSIFAITRAVEPRSRMIALQLAHVRRGAHERERDVVDAEAERELEIDEVLLGQRRNRDRHAGKVDALVRLHPATDDDGAAGAARIDLLDAEPHEAVVDQHVVPRLEHLADHGRRDRQVAVREARRSVGLADDRHLVAGDQEARL